MASESARALPDLPLRNLTLKASLLQIPKQVPVSAENAQEVTGELFDMACIRAGLSNKEIAATLGVSDSLVARWRRPEARERATVTQMVQLGPLFLLAYHKVFGFRFGARRAALLSLVEAVADLAACEDEEQVG